MTFEEWWKEETKNMILYPYETQAKAWAEMAWDAAMEISQDKMDECCEHMQRLHDRLGGEE